MDRCAGTDKLLADYETSCGPNSPDRLISLTLQVGRLCLEVLFDLRRI